MQPSKTAPNTREALILVFCGARDGASKDYCEQANVLGITMVAEGFGLV